MIFSTFIIFLITKLVQELEAELLGGFDPLVCSCRWSRLYLHLDTYPSKINNMQNNSKLHLRAPSKRGCLCKGSTCTSCPARVPPWCLLPTTSSSTSSSWSGGAQEARGWTWPGSTCHFWTRWIRSLRSWENNHRFLWSWLLEVVRRNSGGGTNEVR